MKYCVVIQPRAERDIQVAAHWILGQSGSPAAALRWARNLRAKIATLKTSPERCPIDPDSDAYGAEVRVLLHGKRRGVYRVLFMIRARISPDLKAEAESILDQIGLSSSDAIRMFYKQITMRKGLPFDARVANATTREAARDAEAGRNLTRYADVDDLFRKLRVKSGKS
jgi:DNA-damage-inducible protein J